MKKIFTYCHEYITEKLQEEYLGKEKTYIVESLKANDIPFEFDDYEDIQIGEYWSDDCFFIEFDEEQIAISIYHNGYWD